MAVTDYLDHAAVAAVDPGVVAMVRIPEDRQLLAELRAAGRPRLLLLAPGEPAPVTTDVDEDWIRLPATGEDVQARATVLATRCAGAHRRPRVIDGRLSYDGSWVALSPIEALIVGALAERFGELVRLDELTQGADGHELTPNAVRVHVMRVRKRILGLGLVVRTIHGRGYLLEPAG